MIKYKKYYKYIFLIILLFIFVFFNNPAYAQDNLVVSCWVMGNCQLHHFVELAVKAAQIMFGISGSLALLFFVYGGIVLLISGGSSEQVNKGKQIIIAAVIGLLIVFTSWLIINFILTSLGIDDWWKI